MSMTGLDRQAGARPRLVTRRRLLGQVALLGLSATGAGSLLTACGGGRATESGTINVGVYPYIPDVINLSKIVNSYQAKHKGVRVRVTPLSADITTADAMVQKFTLEARQKKSSYDLIFGVTPWVEVAPLAEAGVLAPIADLVGGDVLDDLLAPARSGATYKDKKIYSLPMWADVVGFIYRSDLLQRYMGSAEPPNSWEKVASTAQQLNGKLPKGITGYGADWAFLHRSFLPIFVTLTDKPFTATGLVNLDDPAAVEALTILQRLHPYMPANANKDLGSSETFQAGKLVMETYWQAQRTRAVTAGLDENVVKMASNPRGDRDSTVFWTTDVIIPAHAKNKEGAAKFLLDGFLHNAQAMQASVDTAGKIPPYASVLEEVKLPEFMQPLAGQLKSGTPLPMNAAYLAFEQPAYKNEIERMLIKGQSPEKTVANLKAAFEKGARS